jgi:hypothetical protein
MGWTVQASNIGGGKGFYLLQNPSRPALGSTQSPRFFPEVKRPEGGVNHPLLSSVRFRTVYSYTCNPLLCPMARYREHCTFTLHQLIWFNQTRGQVAEVVNRRVSPGRPYLILGSLSSSSSHCTYLTHTPVNNLLYVVYCWISGAHC